MQFKFDPNQEYQIDAIEAVADLLEGQARLGTAPRFVPGTLALAAIANQLDLNDEQLVRNLIAVQERNTIAPDTELKLIEDEIDTAEGKRLVRFANFSVEMETGTGKTY